MLDEERTTSNPPTATIEEMPTYRADSFRGAAVERVPTYDLKRARNRYEPPAHSMVMRASLAEILPVTRSLATVQQASLDFMAELSPQERILWCAGDVSLLRRPCVAIVGTRAVSIEGAARARRLGRELAAAGVVVVSGLAKGVDTHALTSAIAAGGKVVAVIGTPIDVAYPAENKHLQEQIYREHLLISQFQPGSRVFPGNFPARNKLMAAVTDATAIIEAAEGSGTLHQAVACTRLGRWLFIAKSVLDDKALSWPHDFEKYEIMKPLRSTQDILEALKLPR